MAFGKHWEWRGFGAPSSRLRSAVEALPLKFPEAQVLTDEYLWVPGSPINVKLRNSDLKFKRLLEASRGLELWLEDPGENYALPLGSDVANKLAHELGIELPPLGTAPLDRAALLHALERASPRVTLVAVKKRRWQREWSGGMSRGSDPAGAVTVELAEIFAPERIISIGLEHPRAELVAEARDALGAEKEMKPLSYLGALGVWAAAGTLGE